MSEVERYLDFHPFRDWTVDRWDEESSILDARFHQQDVFMTPLMGSTLVMPDGIDWDGYWRVKNEIVPAHVNSNTIGRYQRMMGPLYIDTRFRRVRARNRWGTKTQLDQRDEMVTRFGNDTPNLIRAVLRSQMANSIVAITEAIARNGFLNHAQHMYLYNGNQFALGTADFSDIPANQSGLFDVKQLETVALRMSYRSEYARRQWGNYAQPVPGQNFRNSVLIMTTTGTYWGIWNSPEQDYMVDLRQLQDERIINGGQVQYRRFSTISDTGHSLILWNSGTIGKQVAVTSKIHFGDGAPDPDVGPVDSVYYAGQAGDDTVHYIQCSAFDATDFAKGDMVTIHTKRTDDWGITDGVDFTDGESMVAEVYEVQAGNNRLVVREPITYQYEDQFSYTTLAGTAAGGEAYAFVTKGQHIHPTFIMGSREGIQYVRRTMWDGSLIKFHRPSDTNVDFPSIERVTAEWHGETNPWEPDMYEVFFGSGPFANRGDLEW